SRTRPRRTASRRALPSRANTLQPSLLTATRRPTTTERPSSNTVDAGRSLPLLWRHCAETSFGGIVRGCARALGVRAVTRGAEGGTRGLARIGYGDFRGVCDVHIRELDSHLQRPPLCVLQGSNGLDRRHPCCERQWHLCVGELEPGQLRSRGWLERRQRS